MIPETGRGASDIPARSDYYDPEFRRTLPERSNNTCTYCRRDSGTNKYDPDGHTWQIDHVVARSQGGSDDRENLVLACRSCNASKRDRLAPTDISKRRAPKPPRRLVILPQPYAVRKRPRAWLAEASGACCGLYGTACGEDTALRCFDCGAPLCAVHLNEHVAICEIAS